MENKKNVLKYNHKWGFGMAPLKKSTEYSYKRAAYSVLKLLNGDFGSEIELSDISTFKGMVNRCIKQDQWDWFTVYTRFGEPDPVKLRPVPSFIVELRNALKDSNNDKIFRLQKRPIALYVIELCEIFLDRRRVEQPIDNTGYIYILSKREEPNILKVGMTNRNVEQRVKEINSATGVLLPLSVRRIFKVVDARNAEKLIFEELSYYRIRKDREFFMIEFSEAIKLINQLLIDQELLLKY